MLIEKIILSILMSSFVLISSCAQKEKGKVELPQEQADVSISKNEKQHEFGGWYCPDNLKGLPPMDIQDLDQLKVVTDRLPTQEETRNGTALMYIDKTKYPDAKPFDMNLPRVAKIHSRHNGMNELIIIFQAVIVNKDTVVGFRYPNGGNGSARYHEVSLLSDKEVAAIGPAPFVNLNSEINSSKERIWKAFTKTDYAKQLAKKFNQKAFFESDWTANSEVNLNYDADGYKATGYIATVWGNLYLHIDYDYKGFHYTEKMLLFENEEEKKSELIFVAGPYPKDLEDAKKGWDTMMKEIKTTSEK